MTSSCGESGGASSIRPTGRRHCRHFRPVRRCSTIYENADAKRQPSGQRHNYPHLPKRPALFEPATRIGQSLVTEFQLRSSLFGQRYRNESEKIGRDDWIRTSDPLTPSQVRYQAAPHPEVDETPRKKNGLCARPFLLGTTRTLDRDPTLRNHLRRRFGSASLPAACIRGRSSTRGIEGQL